MLILISFPYRDPEKDVAKINSDKNCCICLEDFFSDEDNPIIPSQDESDPQKSNHNKKVVVEDRRQGNETQGQVNHAFQPETSGDSPQLEKNARDKNTNEDDKDAKTENKLTKTIDNNDLVLGLLKCGHVFHFECIWKWMQSRTKCPICRKYTKMSTDDIKAVSLEAVYSDKGQGSNIGSITLEDQTSRPKLRRDVHSIEEEMKRKSVRATSGVGKIRERARSIGNKKEMKGEVNKVCVSTSNENVCQTETETHGSFADNVIEMIRERASSFGSNKGFTELKNENETEEPRSRLGSFGNLMDKIRARANSTGNRDKYVMKGPQSPTSSSQSIELSFQNDEDISRPRLTSFGSKGAHEKITEEQNSDEEDTTKAKAHIVTLTEWKMKS